MDPDSIAAECVRIVKMAELAFEKPPPLNVRDASCISLGENFERWKRQLDIYMLATGAKEKAKKVQCAIILQCAGYDVIDAAEHFVWKKEDGNLMSEQERKNARETPELLLAKIENYCKPRQSEVMLTHRFWSVEWTAPFDAFLTELHRRAENCNFGDTKDRMIRDKIVFSSKGKVQEKLLLEKDLSLVKAVDICRAFEHSKQQLEELKEQKQAHIDRLGKGNGNLGARPKTKANQRDTVTVVKDCIFCGKSHRKGKEHCPAYDKQCSNCKGRNHFAAKCRRAKTHQLAEEPDDPRWLNSIDSRGKKKSVHAKMSINDCEVTFQIDSGAEVNTLNQKFVKREQVQPTTVKLYTWDKSEVVPFGVVKLPVLNLKTRNTKVIEFYVVPNSFQCLLGLTASQEMGLLTVNRDNFIAKVSGDTRMAGDLGVTKLTIDEKVQPVILPCRKVPIAIEQEVKSEIEKLVKREILIPVDEPSTWVSQMAVPRKSSGKIRICIDPQPLNSALLREHYLLPTFDDVLPKLSKARIFSKVDVKEAFWHVKLDEESSKLTTMITPFGRFRWSCLPFGLKVSSEIFAKKLDQAIGHLNGVICVADDIIVVGCGDTDEQAERDHERNLVSLLEQCERSKIVLNKEKMHIKQREVQFLGHNISKDGITACEEKVKAVKDMPAPVDTAGVRRFCGMVQYLARYTPNLADALEPLHQLTRKDQPFDWTPECQNSFDRVKTALSQAPTLAFFDPEKELILQVDSSQDGLGAVLMQEGRPIEYASRNLRPNERNWAQIEKEALAVVWSLERFDQYTYARPVVIHNDHKPLESIFRKPLNQASKRMQGLMMRLFRYNTEYKWIKGADLHVADALSRAFQQSESDHEEEEARVLSIDSVQIPRKRMQQIREETEKDPQLQKVISFILNGWPDKKSDVLEEAKEYFDIRDSLSVLDDVVYKGERVVVPKSCRAEVKEKLHAAHLGHASMMRRARECIFWPGLQKEIKILADSCLQCQVHKPANQKEEIQQHSNSGSPWQKIACDLFTIEGRNYLVVVDYETDFIEVEYCPTTTSNQIISSIKKICARYGLPQSIVTDGGPQFTSAEFNKFVEGWGIEHTITSPYHSQSNGKAEAAVKSIKKMMMKCRESNSDQYLALLEFRNTPRQDGPSPAEQLFGRKIATSLPMKPTETSTRSFSKDKRKQSVAKHYNKGAKNLPELSRGQSVFFKKTPNAKWEKGQVIANQGNRKYTVKGETGGVYQRNRVHIKTSNIPFVDDSCVFDDLDILGGPIDTDETNPPSSVLPRSRRTCRTPTYLNSYDLSGPR